MEDIGIAINVRDDAVLDVAKHLRVRVYRPLGAGGELPVLVYLHGAGWVFDGSRTHDLLARSLAVSSGAVVLLPTYAPAPEAPHPAALEQCYQLLVLIAEGRLRRAFDPSRIVVAGDGTGATLAAGLALLSSRRKRPRLASQVLLCPALDPACDTPSFREFESCAHLHRDDVLWLWEQYLPNRASWRAATGAPLEASRVELQDLPPALVVTAEVDVLRDDGELYARRLQEAGVDVLAVRYLGAVHGFCHLDALRESPSARAVVWQVSEFLRRASSSSDESTHR